MQILPCDRGRIRARLLPAECTGHDRVHPQRRREPDQPVVGCRHRVLHEEDDQLATRALHAQIASEAVVERIRTDADDLVRRALQQRQRAIFRSRIDCDHFEGKVGALACDGVERGGKRPGAVARQQDDRDQRSAYLASAAGALRDVIRSA